MSALLSPVNTNTAPTITRSTADLRDGAVNAVLVALTHAAVRHDSGAVADLSAALRILEGGN